MAQSTWWDKVRMGGKKGFDGAWKQLDKLGAPVNKLSNKLGSEAFWPTTLDKESDKAARILKSFCSKCWDVGCWRLQANRMQRTASTRKKSDNRLTGRTKSKRWPRRYPQK